MTAAPAATAKAVLRFAVFAAWTALLLPLQIAVVALFSRSRAIYPLSRLWSRGVCRLFGIRIVIAGQRAAGEQILFACNHVSYLDIPVLASVLDTSFVAKADVAAWPLFGFIAKLQQTVFVSRSRTDASDGNGALAAFLAGGRNMTVFPEGTSSDGSSVLPFKSSLFDVLFRNAAPDAAPAVQPVTIEILETDGQAVADGADRDVYAWHGDMTLLPHLWKLARSKGACIKLHFHPLRRARDGSGRKDMARLCHKDVAAPLQSRIECPGSEKNGKERGHEQFHTAGNFETSDLSPGQIRQ